MRFAWLFALFSWVWSQPCLEPGALGRALGLLLYQGRRFALGHARTHTGQINPGDPRRGPAQRHGDEPALALAADALPSAAPGGAGNITAPPPACFSGIPPSRGSRETQHGTGGTS